MTMPSMKRRQFFRTSGGVAAGAALAAGAGGVLTSRPAAAMTTTALTDHEAATLLGVTRQLYPHPSLADEYYLSVVTALDQKAAGDAATARLLKDGVAGLDKALDIPWVRLSPGYQLQVLESLQDTAFFKTLRSTTVVDLYNNHLVWRHFGYEGASWPHGGYYKRGFNDLTWLPEPPESASPKGWWEDNNG